MNEKRFTTEIVDWWKTANQTKIVKENEKWIDADDCASLLNALYEENEFLTWNYKELVQFVKSKGYKLGDFLDYLGQFQSIGVEKEEWGEELVDKIKELKYALQQRTKQCDELYQENQQYKKELTILKQPSCRKCIHYSTDGVADYCMNRNGLLGDEWTMFPFKWDYTEKAKECEEYEE